MTKLLTLAFILFSLSCFAQDKKFELDSIKTNAWEYEQLNKHITGDKAQERNRIQERIAFLQRELQLLDESKDNMMLSIMNRENKIGMPIAFRNGYLIIQKQKK